MVSRLIVSSDIKLKQILIEDVHAALFLTYICLYKMLEQ